ncbi:hypothetical protein E2C01_045683 [Portunus trituberculatus]|uniref:Uncharacterized protein n=1 Tax=Portunus trituberculatus TaxID=210409 RepID=A0A5B7FVS5_PORTR|nr:hypothetical protein [Portunus trituberculatus]
MPVLGGRCVWEAWERRRERSRPKTRSAAATDASPTNLASTVDPRFLSACVWVRRVFLRL